MKFKRRHQPRPPAAALKDDEIIGLNHPLANDALIRKLLPDGPRVPIDDLQAAASLLTNSVAYSNASTGGLMALAQKLNLAIDRDFRAAQERNLKSTGKARP